MLPAPLRPFLRPRYFTWLLFVLLFFWAFNFYRHHPKHPLQRAKQHDKARQAVEMALKTVEKPVDDFVMVGGKRVGKEWVEVPSNVDLPPGLDIEVDMQTHHRRVRLHEVQPDSYDARHKNLPTVASANVEGGEDAEFSPMPQKKWQRIYNSQHKSIIDQTLEALASKEEPEKIAEALEYLEEHAGTIDVGAGLVRSTYFPNLLETLTQESGNPRRRLSASEIIFASVQNNPVAIEGILDTPAVEKMVGHLEWEDDGIINRRVLSSLIAIVRGDKTDKSLLQLAKQQTVLALSHLATKMLRDQQVLDRILVLLVALADKGGRYAEHDSAINLMENILKNMKRPYSDWMTHAFRPFCAGKPEFLEWKPSLKTFCSELNANPNDTSVL